MKLIFFMTVLLSIQTIGICEDWICKTNYKYKFKYSGVYVAHGKDFNEKDKKQREIERLYIKLDVADKVISIPFTWLDEEQKKELNILDKKSDRNIKEKVKLLHKLSDEAEKAEVLVNKLIEAYHDQILPPTAIKLNKQKKAAFANNVLTNIATKSKQAAYIQTANVMNAYVFDYARSGKYGYACSEEDYKFPLDSIQFYQQVLTSEWGSQVIFYQGDELMTFKDVWEKMPITYE